MVVYETISGKLPFHKHTDLAVFMKVVEGERPPRGMRFTESLWKMLELCWMPQPNDRPSIEDVLQCLETVSNSSDLEGAGDDDNGRDSGTGSPGDTTTTESNTTVSSTLNHSVDRPPSSLSTVPRSSVIELGSEADVDSLSCEVAGRTSRHRRPIRTEVTIM